MSLRNLGIGAMALLLVLPFAAFAQTAPADVPIRSEGALIALLLRIIGLLRTVFWIAVVFFLILAAFYYLTSGGGAGVEKANKMLMYAVIAIVVALVATSLPYLVRSLLGGGA